MLGALGAVLAAVMEVVGATVGSLGAVLGVKNCSEHKTLNSPLSTAISKPQSTTKKKELPAPMNLVAVNLGQRKTGLRTLKEFTENMSIRNVDLVFFARRQQ